MKRFVALLLGLMFGVNIFSGVCLAEETAPKSPIFGKIIDGSEDSELFDLSEEDYAAAYIGMIFKYIFEDYVGGEIDEETLVQGALKGMADKLDDYSEFFTTEEYYKFYKTYSNDIYLIGVSYISNEDGYPEVTNIIKDSAAEKANIKVGDVILEINGEDLKNKKIIDIVDKRVSEGLFDFSLKISSDGIEKTVNLNAEPVEVSSVFDINLRDALKSKNVLSNVAFIRIESFSVDTHEEFKEIMDDNIKKGKTRLILDLRGNGGGLMDEAYYICDYLMKGEIARLRTKELEQVISSELEGERPFEKIVVLTDCLTASAAELLAVALKEDGAVVVGQRSYGKGVIQEIVPLGEIGFLKLTTREYFSRSGKKINKTGVDPDVEIKLPVYIDDFEIDYNDERLADILEYLGYEHSTQERIIAAIEDIQEINGLRKTGILDDSTIYAVNYMYMSKVNEEDLILKKGYEEVLKD